jgi:hypothetical protein
VSSSQVGRNGSAASGSWGDLVYFLLNLQNHRQCPAGGFRFWVLPLAFESGRALWRKGRNRKILKYSLGFGAHPGDFSSPAPGLFIFLSGGKGLLLG